MSPGGRGGGRTYLSLTLVVRSFYYALLSRRAPGGVAEPKVPQVGFFFHLSQYVRLAAITPYIGAAPVASAVSNSISI